MAELTRTYHWERFAPNIGNNLELRPQDRIYFDVAVGVTVTELVEFHGALSSLQQPSGDAATEGDILERSYRPAANALAEKWGRFVKLVGQHSINGKPLVTLSDYLVQALSSPGIYNVVELVEKVDHLNSVKGSKELFSDALSGGFSSMEEQSSAPERERTAGP